MDKETRFEIHFFRHDISGAVYSCSKSGWFDINTLNQWFVEVFLPHYQELPPGKKVMIGDNLECHFSEEVIFLYTNTYITLLRHMIILELHLIT